VSSRGAGNGDAAIPWRTQKDPRRSFASLRAQRRAYAATAYYVSASGLLRHIAPFHEQQTSSSWTARERGVIQDPLKAEFRLNWILDVRAVHLQNDDLSFRGRVQFRTETGGSQ
jgi:hypothetical protein